MTIHLKKTGSTTEGVFTVKEYQLEEIPDPSLLVRCLQAGPGEVMEVITYVFEGEDPLETDAQSYPAGEFAQIYPKMKACGYGEGLAFDVILQIDGHPATVELSEGSSVIAVRSLDRDLEVGDLLAPVCEETEETRQEDLFVPPDGEAELTPQKLLEILSVAERLKCNTRHCETSSGRQESVAEHSWRIALMAMLLSGSREFAGTDLNRVIRMCLIHDLGEAFTGDIPTFEKTSADEAGEEELYDRWVGGFPGTLRDEFRALLGEMKELRTPEAKLFKALDKIEAVIQHNESDISSWLPLEYGLQLTYGREEMQFSPFLRALRACVDDWTREKIANHSEFPTKK